MWTLYQGKYEGKRFIYMSNRQSLAVTMVICQIPVFQDQ